MRTINPRFYLRPDFDELLADAQAHIMFNHLSIACRAMHVIEYILSERLHYPSIARQVRQSRGLLESASFEIHRRRRIDRDVE